MSDLRFTDEDLKRLKEDATSKWSCGCTMCHLKYEPMLRQMTALLARLEAAENFNSCVRVILSKKHPDNVDAHILSELNETWRKSAGK